ncbi:YARHG domain-containing protein, partial [Prochlorococcus sp. AH-716-D22]|nr:YARHG domain-containing protein [Prochlorococcus sp. AH-716-D22]
MNIRLLSVITILSLCCIFGFEKTSYSFNKVSQDDISELKILKYLPKDNKTFFVSNTKSSKIINVITKNFDKKNQDELDLVKNSILAYLGIDLGTNKLEDIYNNELAITTYYNKEKGIDDALIIFKIK